MKDPHASAIQFFCVALVLLVALSLAACGGSDTTASSSPSPTSSVPSLQEVMAGGASPSATPSAPPLPAPAVAGTIAFCKVVKAEADGDADIYTVRPDGTRLTRLTDSPGWEESPSWSPDGKQITFTRNREHTTSGDFASVWVMNADGSGARQLTSAGCTGPKWSPDGSSIAYVHLSKAAGDDLFVMNADGSGQMAVVPGKDDQGRPAWTADGRILFSRGLDELWVVKPDGRGLQPVLKDVMLGGYAASPDAEGFAYEDTNADAVLVGPLPGDAEPRAAFEPVSTYVFDPAAVPAWRPASKVLAVAAYSGGHSILGSPLYVVNADGSGLSAVPGVEAAMDPAWRPE